MNESKKMALLAVEALEDKKQKTLQLLILVKYPFLQITLSLQMVLTAIRYRLWLTAQKKLSAKLVTMQTD